jgi:hypothetical protein
MELLKWKEFAVVKTCCRRLLLGLISASVFCKRSEGNSLLTCALFRATRYLESRCRVRLPRLYGFHSNAQFFPQLSVRPEKPKPYRHR